MQLSKRGTEILVRNHFEKYGHFNDLRTESWYSFVRTYAKEENIPVSDYPYSILGFSPTELLSEREVFYLKRAYYQNDTSYIRKLLKRKNLEISVEQLMQSQGITVKDKRDFLSSKKYGEIVALLAYAIKENDKTLLKLEKVNFTIYSYCEAAVYSEGFKASDALNQFVFGKPQLMEAIKKLLPKLVVNPNIEMNCVYQNNFYVKEEVDYDELLKDAIKSLFMNIDYFKPNVAEIFNKIAARYVTPQVVMSGLTTGINSLRNLFVELSLMSDLPLATIYGLSDYIFVDHSRTLDEGVFIMPDLDGYVKVFSHMVAHVDECISISQEQFRILYERNKLSTLTFKPGKFPTKNGWATTEKMAYVEDLNSVPLYEVLSETNVIFNNNPNDFHLSNYQEV